MELYLLNSTKGLLHSQKKEKTPEDCGNIILLSREEFEKESLPYQKNLLYSMDFIRYCKVELFHDCIQGTMRIPKLNSKKHEIFTFGFYLVKNRLYLIDGNKGLKPVMEKVKNEISEGSTLHTVLLLIFNFLIDDDNLELQKIEQGLEKVEEELLRKIPEKFNETMMLYRRQLSESLGYYKQLVNIGECMQVYGSGEAIPDERQGWERYIHRTERLHSYVEEIKEYLKQLRELYQTQIDIQQNRVMTVLTIVTTVFLPLTLITGWYGMNFIHMPELQWKYGYVGVFVLSLLVAGGEICFFKKRKML